MILSSGVEIEGGWNELPPAFFNTDNKFNHKVYRSDISVKGLSEVLCLSCTKNKRYCQCENSNFDSPDTELQTFQYVGEIASYPFYNINNLLNWIDQYYAIKTNQFCGLHYHIKPENLNEYQNLMSPKFYRDYINAIKSWAQSRSINKDSELYRRLNGKNHYVQKGFKPHRDGQDPEHYRMVNYCYAKHGTIEFRLLPAFQSKKLAIDGIRFTYDFVNTWLAINKISKKNEITRVFNLGDL